VTYTDFSNKMQIALYQECEINDSTYVRFKEMMEKHGLSASERWIERLAEEWEGSGFAEVQSFIGSPFEWGAEISAQGMRNVEELYGDKDGVGTILSPISSAPDGALSATEPDGPPIHSSAWTGLPASFVFTDAIRVDLLARLDDAGKELDSLALGNSEKAQIRAFILAAKELTEAPDPPADLIWELIGRANSIAGIASLFVSIIALFA
jgi:hypothetical protein